MNPCQTILFVSKKNYHLIFFKEYIGYTGLFFCMTEIIKIEEFDRQPTKNAWLNFFGISTKHVLPHY